MANRLKKIDTRKVILILGIIFVACNLRASITSVGPLISAIRDDMGISNGAAGFLTTLPLLAFAFLSPLAPKIAQQFGNETTVFAGLFVLLVGISLRSSGVLMALFLGTAFIGIGIAIANVLLPSIVKHRFPNKVGLMTSLYSTVMGTFAALASGVSVPLAHDLSFGWQGSLLFWGGLVIVAVVIWLPQLRKNEHSGKGQAAVSKNGSVWRSALAWQVTFFMGLQSFLFYCTIAWLTEIVHSQGMSVQSAGWMLALMQFASLPASFLTPILADRFTNQRGIVVCLGFLYLTGFLGILLSANLFFITLAIVCIGLAQGGCISLSLAFLGLRADNAQQAGALSGMAQSIGYLLAAIGPTLIGVLVDSIHSWTPSLILLINVTVFMTITGVGAGKDASISDSLEAKNA